MRKLALLAGVASLTLAGAGAARADGPVITTQTVTRTSSPFAPCGSEWMLADFTATWRTESFYDGSELVLLRRHIVGEGAITLPSTGQSLPYVFRLMRTVDTQAQTATVTGHLHVLVPGGGGIVHRTAGRLVQDISQFPPVVLESAGPQSLFESGGTAELCAALGA